MTEAEVDRLSSAVVRDLEDALAKHAPLPSVVAVLALNEVLTVALVSLVEACPDALADVLAGVDLSVAAMRASVLEAVGSAGAVN